MNAVLIMEISGSIAVTIAIMTTLWMFIYTNHYTATGKIIALGIAAYTSVHLFIHSMGLVAISIEHLIIDDGFLILTALINVMNSKIGLRK